MDNKFKNVLGMSLYVIASVLPVCVGLGFMVGCNDGMASVGYVTGPSFIPFAGVINAFSEYGMPGGRKGASNGFYIWLGFCFIVAIIRWAKEESAKVIEAAIRKAAKKPRGELTKADYEKVTVLELYENQLTSVKGLEKLTQLKKLDIHDNKLTSVEGLEKLKQLEGLHLNDNPDLTRAQIDELKKALPKCKIYSDFDLTKAQIDELQKALPKCTIFSNPTK
tara:strand:- start:65 stop:730 length:666 start_codon:yes stop_codon:yes gene_type:complete